MAFPFTFEENFELGTKGDFDTESDTGGLLDFPHYSALAGIPGMEVPFRGAYCMRIVCGDTNDHTLQEGDLNIADTGTEWLRFYLFISNDFAATADDIFNIFEWQSTSNVVEACISLQITAATNQVDIAIADGTEASSNFNLISKGVWHSIEAKNNTETNATGTLDLIVDGSTLTQLTSIDSSLAITHGLLGTQNTESTTTGTLLFDQFIFDEDQIFPIARRFPETLTLLKSGHVFVGPGKINNITLVSSGDGTADSVAELWDTDTADRNDISSMKARLANTAASEIVDPAGMPVDITRGAYVRITVGTADAEGPKAIVQIGHASAYSRGRIKDYGIKRGGV